MRRGRVPGGPRRAAAARPRGGRLVPRGRRDPARRADRALPDPRGDRRGRVRDGVPGAAVRAGASRGGAEGREAGHGHAGDPRPLRGGAAGARPDEPPRHRAGARRRHDGARSPLLRHGARAGRARHALRRRGVAGRGGTAPPVPAGVSRDPARPPQGHRPPRHQALERARDPAGGRPRGQGDRFRRRQGDRAAPDRGDPRDAGRPHGRYARIHESRAGGDART